MTSSQGLPRSLQPSALEAHGRALRRLAVSLVRDEAEAEDVVQETWIRALRSPPTEAGAAHWLRVVTRNVARTVRRTRVRRERREEVAATPEALPSVESVVERGDLLQLVSQAVMRLPEPYRTTLLLRYYEDRSTEEVATALGVAEATVRSRVHRGLERLRGELDGDRTWGEKRWVRALLPLVGLDPRVLVSGTTASTAAVGAGGATAGLLVALGLTLGATGWWVTTHFGDRSPARPVGEETAATSGEFGGTLERERDTVPVGDAGPERRQSESAATAVAEAVREYRLEGTVLDPAGHPVEGARVEFNQQSSDVPAAVSTDRDGAFSIRSPLPIRDVWARAVGLGSSGLHEVLGDERERIELRLLAEGGEVAGVVRDRFGRTLANARLRIGARMGAAEGAVGAEERRTLPTPPAAVLADMDGHFEVVGLAPGRHPVLVFAPGHVPWNGEVDVVAGEVASLEPRLETGAVVRGTVRDEQGAVVPGAWVGVSPLDPFLPLSAICDENGDYELQGVPLGRVRLSSTFEDRYAERWFEADEGRIERRQWDPVLRRGGELSLRIVDEAGQPWPNFRVDAQWTPPPSAGTSMQTFLDRWKTVSLRERTLRTDEDGKVLLSHPVRDLPVHARVLGPWRDWPQALAELEHAMDGTTVEVVVPRGALDCGHADLVLEDSAGLPAEVLRVAVRPADSSQAPLVVEHAGNSDGVLRVGPLPPGEWELLVDLPTQALTPVGRCTVRAGEVVELSALRLPEPGTLEVLVGPDPAAAPARVDVLVERSFETKSDRWTEQQFPARELVRSVLLVEGRGRAVLLPGRYRLRPLRAGAQPISVEVTSGRTTRVVLD